MRLAHRVKELDELPHNLSDMPSMKKVRNWYAQSFEVRSNHSYSCYSPLLHAGAHHLSSHLSPARHPPSPHGPPLRALSTGINTQSIDAGRLADERRHRQW